ncbi:LPFR motif small protein [Streptomyces sp. NPDC058272]
MATEACGSTVTDVFRAIGNAFATVVTLPFRALARLFVGASRSAD